MKIFKGKSKDDPILLKRSDVDKNMMNMQVESFEKSDTISSPRYASSDSYITFLDILFGGQDYTYFIKSEQTYTETNVGVYKIFNVEDMDGDDHSIFFLTV